MLDENTISANNAQNEIETMIVICGGGSRVLMRWQMCSETTTTALLFCRHRGYGEQSEKKLYG
jgi:hypothetical protein